MPEIKIIPESTEKKKEYTPTEEGARSAVAKGNLEDLKYFLKQGYDVNTQSLYHRQTLLHRAAAHGHGHIARFLLEQSPKLLDMRDYGAQTALSFSAVFGYRHIAQLLLDKGANIDSVGSDKRTALHRAAARRDFNMVALLLDRKANSNHKDLVGETPLKISVSYEDQRPAVTHLLLLKAYEEHKEKKNPMESICAAHNITQTDICKALGLLWLSHSSKNKESKILLDAALLAKTKGYGYANNPVLKDILAVKEPYSFTLALSGKWIPGELPNSTVCDIDDRDEKINKCLQAAYPRFYKETGLYKDLVNIVLDYLYDLAKMPEKFDYIFKESKIQTVKEPYFAFVPWGVNNGCDLVSWRGTQEGSFVEQVMTQRQAEAEAKAKAEKDKSVVSAERE